MYYSSVNAGHAITLILICTILAMAALVVWAYPGLHRCNCNETEDHEDSQPARPGRAPDRAGRHRAGR